MGVYFAAQLLKALRGNVIERAAQSLPRADLFDVLSVEHRRAIAVQAAATLAGIPIGDLFTFRDVVENGNQSDAIVFAEWEGQAGERFVAVVQKLNGDREIRLLVQGAETDISVGEPGRSIALVESTVLDEPPDIR